MGQSNAYFQLEAQQGKTFIKFFPPTEGGKILEIGEITSYLERHGCKDYNIKELNRGMYLKQVNTVSLGELPLLKTDEEMVVRVSDDKMTAWCRFFPPAEGGENLGAQQIVNQMQSLGIKNGIDQEEVLKFLRQKTYCTEYALANGKRPIHGKDAKIEYFFNTSFDLKPKKNEDGTVDYRELNTISHVEKGARLAKLIKEDTGRPGIDLYGQEVKPRTVKAIRLEHGKNISLSEDQTELYSDVNGHANIVEGKVFVSDVYEVPADVDNSTGNINYPGNVYVKGNVKGGFTITAQGDVIVDGVVEDATIQAGGQIIVQRGIHGMMKGVLKAQGNIICKFIENAIVSSGGYIETEAIMHSQVSASSEIRVEGKKGLITGGVVRAANLISAQTIGSNLGTSTRLEVGVAPEQKERFAELQSFIQQSNKAMEQIRPILMTYSNKLAHGEKLAKDKVMYVQQLAKALKTKEEEVNAIREEYTQLHEILLQDNNARIKVHKVIHSGVTVTISDISVTMPEDRNFCQLVKEQGEIVFKNI